MADDVSAHREKKMTVALQGRQVTKTLAELFDEDTSILLAALAEPINEVFISGDSANSPFFTSILPSARRMATALNGVSINGVAGVTIVRNWVDAGCPASIPKMQVFRKPEVTEAKPGAQARLHALLRRTPIFGIDEVH
jgi:hypothetical protein